MSATENVTPAEIAVVVDALSAVAEGIGYRLVKESDLIQVFARSVTPGDVLDAGWGRAELEDQTRQHLSRRLANEIAKHITLTPLPHESGAEIYEVRLTLIKPGASDPHKAAS